MTGYIDWGRKFIIWFKLGFYVYVLHFVFTVIATVGICLKSSYMIGCGDACNVFCIFPLGIVWTIFGVVWRFSEEGALVSSLGETQESGTGYVTASGMFMLIFLII